MCSTRLTTPRWIASRLSDASRRWLYVVAMLVLLSLLGFLYLTQTSQVTIQIDEMQTLERQLHELKQANSELLLQIAQYEQLSRIQQEAKAMGFGKPQHIEYVQVLVDEPTPLSGDATIHSGAAPSRIADSHLPDWWHRILRQFAAWIHVGVAPVEQADR